MVGGFFGWPAGMMPCHVWLLWLGRCNLTHRRTFPMNISSSACSQQRALGHRFGRRLFKSSSRADQHQSGFMTNHPIVFVCLGEAKV